MRRVSSGIRACGPSLCVLTAVCIGLALPASASAVPKALLTTLNSPAGTPGQGGVFGASVGQASARGIAVNQSTGDFYVVDGTVHRIQQFQSDGTFVRAWGWDVVQAGGIGDDTTGTPNEFEICTVASQCKVGIAGNNAGQLNNPMGVAVDQTNDYVYVTNATSRRVSVYSATGQFAGAFGWGAASGAATLALEVCTTTCAAAAAAGAQAGNFSNLNFGNPAIDPSGPPGTIYVPDQGNLRVSKFATTISGGVLTSVSFVKAFGWDVATGAVDEEQEVRIRATAGTFTLTFSGQTTGDLPFNASAGDVQTALNGLSSINAGGGSVTVTGGPGDATGTTAYVVRFNGAPLAGTDVAQLTAANGASPLTGGSGASVLTRAAGGTTTGLESCTTASGCKVGVSGGGSGQFPAGGAPTGAAVDSTGSIYVVSGPYTSPLSDCTATAPCRIQKFNPSTTSASDFGPAPGDPGAITNTTSTDAGNVAGLDVAIDSTNDHVFVNLRSASTAYQVREYDGSTGALIETHPPGNLTSGSTLISHGLAIGTAGRVYSGATGTTVYILGPVPDASSTVSPVTDVTATTATFSGSVTIPPPGSPAFVTKYHFEYSSNGVVWTNFPGSDQNVGDGTTGTHAITNDAAGLQPCTTYVVRASTTTGNASVLSTNTVGFTTDCVAPRIAQTYVENVTKTKATLGAHINPEGLAAKYHFEWGTEPCSGGSSQCTDIPATERQLGNGRSIVVATEDIDGLTKETTYHYRVVATNTEGTTTGPDQTFETLNDCGLTADRCYELVSRSDKGPLGIGGGVAAFTQFSFKAAAEGAGAAYTIAYGAPDSTSGGDPLYQASRGATGWSSTQLSASVSATDPDVQGSMPGAYFAMASDLSCGLYVTSQRLADDAPQEVLDIGGYLLYRRNSDGSWTTVTDRPVLNDAQSLVGTQWPDQYQVIGMSDEPGNRCKRVVFRSSFHYPGVGGLGAYRLYEWNDGVLSNVGVIPGPGGPVDAVVMPGAWSSDNSQLNQGLSAYNFSGAVSRGASRVVFQAYRQASPKPAEVGKRGVFVRDSGQTGVDMSLSQTAIPNDSHSRYEATSADGEHVFFTARYGLAGNGGTNGPTTCDPGGTGGLDEPNPPGCDLYRYSVADGSLASVTGVNSNSAGASVAGAIDVADDASRVYFAARGQLVAGKGKSEAANIADDTYSIYLSTGATPAAQPTLRFVGTLAAGGTFGFDDTLVNARTKAGEWTWALRVSTDGRRLLFPSVGDVEGDGGGAGSVAQAYLYDADADRTICLSCRRNRVPSALSANVPVSSTAFNPPVALTPDGRRAFFNSPDRLAPGAVEGKNNAYMWEDGQVSLIAANAGYLGASFDGDQIYFATGDRFTWQDVDDKFDIYVARVGGGFPAPVAAVPCDPLTTSSCTADRAGDGPVSSSVETSGAHGGDADVGSRAEFSVAGLSRIQRASLVAGRRIQIAVRVNRAGLISVRGTAFVAGFRTRVLGGAVAAYGKGRYRVPVALSRPAISRLRRAGSLRIALVVRFAGARRAIARQVKLRAPDPARRRTAITDRRAGR
jgi:hypothetical protein